ncbi:MAG: response regulator [Desulfobacterales bacterium]|nr:response regulator [Desulfobacterales bacterium]
MTDKKRILLVDDSDLIAGILTQFLEKSGYSILRAKNGVQGVEMAYKEIPDLIIMDVEMPMMQGYQASRLLKHRRGVRDIPIIMHTSLSGDKDKYWGASCGVDAFVNKDFNNLDKILSHVEKLCDHPPYNLEVIREDAKSVNKDYIFEMIGAFFDQQLFASTIVNMLGEVGKHIESLPETISSILELLSKVCEFHAAVIIIQYEKKTLAYILPSENIFKSDIDEFYNVCMNNFFKHFPESDPEETSQIFFGIDNRPNFNDVRHDKQEFRSYTCYEFKGKGDAVFGTLHIGNLGNNYFSDLISENISIFAEAAATVLENSVLFNQVSELERARLINERLVQMDKLKDEFLANTSHELRTPLNGIIGIAESLFDGVAGPLDKQVRKNLSLIVSSGKRLANLVNDILDFSKMKSHDLKIRKKPVSIKVVADIVLTLSKTLARGKDLTLKNDITGDIPPVRGDEERLQQILHNLVGNAVKFTESGTVTVSAREQDEMVAITVTDTGIGIPEDKIGDVFRSFEQVDSSAAREYGGTGLGLAVTKQLAELHGGTIRVESQVGKGSAFTFTLPVSEDMPETSAQNRDIAKIRDIEETEEPEIAAATENITEPEGDFRILVVDDEPVNQQVLANYLSSGNYNVTKALNGTEALRLIETEKKFDLVLLDIMMPKMSGYEVSQKIREKYLPSELPVIMLTAKNQVSDLVEGFSCGANDYLAKPLSKNELLSRIKTHLNLLKINTSYNRFFPRDYLRLLQKESILDVSLGDHISKEMAIMFSDIRSFTSMSEKMTPQELFNFINAYLRRVNPVIKDHGGFVVKYMGDGIMAVFPYCADDAVSAGIDKLRRISQYNVRRRKQGYQPIKVGIGVHIGHMMVGIVGDEARMEGDALSDNVNLTSRLEGLTKFYGVSMLISEETFNNLKTPVQYQTRFLDKVKVKGKENAISVFEICDGEPEDIIELRMKTKPDFEEGQHHYYAREFAEAGMCFKKVLKANPDDKTARLYLERSGLFMVQGVPDDWEGVETMKSK